MQEIVTSVNGSRFDAAKRRRALLGFVVVAALSGLMAIGGAVAVAVSDWPAWTQLLPLMAAIVAGICGTVALAIICPQGAKRVMARLAPVIFYGGLVGLVLLVWVFSTLFRYTNRIAALQKPEARAVRTSFGGELTIAELQGAIRGNDTYYKASLTTMAGTDAAAYLVWPLQFSVARDLIAVLGVLGFVSMLAMFAIWWERKVAGRIQSRLGPMRVGGWHGWAQSMADGIKLIQKEDLIPAGADRLLFRLAPHLAFVPVFTAFVAVPFGAAWVFRDLDVSLLFVLALLSVDVISVIVGGWASNNKWSMYGAMREACQKISYEIPLGLSLLVPVMTVGSLRLSDYGAAQSAGFHSWLVFSNPFAFVAAWTFFISALASCKRSPFDLPEAESELVAGFHTEYSGFRWCLFFFGEYTAMFIVGALASLLFFGAWNSPFPLSWGGSLLDPSISGRWLRGLFFSGPLWFIGKCLFLVFVQIWLRWTLPRIRIDQVMYACVQVLLPMTMVLLLGTTMWQWLVPAKSLLALGANVGLTLIGAIFVLGFVVLMGYGLWNRRRLVGTMVIDHLPGA